MTIAHLYNEHNAYKTAKDSNISQQIWCQYTDFCSWKSLINLNSLSDIVISSYIPQASDNGSLAGLQLCADNWARFSKTLRQS